MTEIKLMVRHVVGVDYDGNDIYENVIGIIEKEIHTYTVYSIDTESGYQRAFINQHDLDKMYRCIYDPLISIPTLIKGIETVINEEERRYIPYDNQNRFFRN